jgi:hypothetical protein
MNTSQLTEREKIKAKIKALAEKTVSNGCTEEEAMAAMQGVGRLLAQYNLTMEEIDVRSSPFKTILIPIGRQRRHPIDNAVTALARFIDGKTWFQGRRNKGSSYAFFGQEQDLELVEYLFKVIHNAIDTESVNFKNSAYYREEGEFTPRKTLYVSFQKGMARRIAERLNEIKAANDAELAAARTTGRSLIVLKSQLVEQEYKIVAKKLRLRMTYSYSAAPESGAYGLGKKAGDKVNLSRPLAGTGNVKGYLK